MWERFKNVHSTTMGCVYCIKLSDHCNPTDSQSTICNRFCNIIFQFIFEEFY